jgi:hypothetical protein
MALTFDLIATQVSLAQAFTPGDASDLSSYCHARSTGVLGVGGAGGPYNGPDSLSITSPFPKA